MGIQGGFISDDVLLKSLNFLFCSPLVLFLIQSSVYQVFEILPTLNVLSFKHPLITILVLTHLPRSLLNQILQKVQLFTPIKT